jgi:hypothetical protein
LAILQRRNDGFVPSKIAFLDEALRARSQKPLAILEFSHLSPSLLMRLPIVADGIELR